MGEAERAYLTKAFQTVYGNLGPCRFFKPRPCVREDCRRPGGRPKKCLGICSYYELRETC